VIDLASIEKASKKVFLVTNNEKKIDRYIELPNKSSIQQGTKEKKSIRDVHDLSRPFHIYFFNSCQEININPFHSIVSDSLRNINNFTSRFFCWLLADIQEIMQREKLT
jgi:hypothetical protein